MTEMNLSPPSTDHEQKTRNSELMADIDMLHTVADEVNPTLQARMAIVALNFGGCLFQPAEVKSRGRIYEKVTGDYGGDLSRLKDAVRCRLTHAGHPVQGGAYIERIIRRANYPIAIDADTGREMVKSGFVRQGRELPIDSLVRYTDIKITIELYDGSGQKVLGEIVIATPEMAAATKVEHPLYEIIRTMEAEEKREYLMSSEDGIGTNSVRSDMKKRLDNISEAFYAMVAESLSKRMSLDEPADD